MTIQKHANQIARQAGYGQATKITLGTRDGVLSHSRHGYYKYTTGERVSNAYRANFGWKNTDYCAAQTAVEVAVSLNHLAYAL